MRTRSDAELLTEYAANQSEAAFGEIVRRYSDTVYSAALRQVGNDAQARDVAQTVFVDLARKAASLGANTVLIGWLHRAARLSALEVIRKEQRRVQRERQAMEFHDPAPEHNDWHAVRPVLDEAVASLGDLDRHALLLRFFHNENLASVGATLGVSEDAAQKRVSRALDKLRELLAERGINTTAAALSVALAANVVQSAPTGFAAALTAGALTKAAAAGSSTVPLLKLFTYTHMKTAILLLTLAGGLAGMVVVRVQSQHRLREAQALAQQQEEEIEALRGTNEQLANQTNELARLRGEALEVLRLRGEVTRLRQEQTTQKAVAAPAETAREEANSPTNSSAPRILLAAKFVMLPTEDLKALSLAGMPNLQSGLITTLTEQQTKIIGDALDGATDVDVLSKPQIITSSGTPGSVSVTKSVLWGDTNAQVGITLELSPEFSTSIFNLGLLARLTQLVDISQQKNGSQNVLENLEVPANVSILPNQTMVLVKDIPKEGNLGIGDFTNSVAGPKTLLVFVTPSVFYEDRIRPGERLTGIIRKGDTNTFIGTTSSNPPAR